MATRIPALAEVSDVEARMKRTFTDDELDNVEDLLDEASEIVRVEAGTNWTSPDNPSVASPPRIVVRIVLRMVTRAIQNPDGLASESAADYSYQRNGVGPDGALFLTPQERTWLQRGQGVSGVWTQPTTRGERYLEGAWLEDSYGCELFPVGR